MKYWNKSKEVRQRCWTCVKLKLNYTHPHTNNPYQGWTTWARYDEVKAELQRMPSKSKFYMSIDRKEVWFENGKDATWFALKYTEILA